MNSNKVFQLAQEVKIGDRFAVEGYKRRGFVQRIAFTNKKDHRLFSVLITSHKTDGFMVFDSKQNGTVYRKSCKHVISDFTILEKFIGKEKKS